METITINIEKRTKDIFQETVKQEFGLKKGTLGRAVNEALLKWVEEKRQKMIVEDILRFLKKGLSIGGIKYKSRDEIYER